MTFDVIFNAKRDPNGILMVPFFDDKVTRIGGTGRKAITINVSEDLYSEDPENSPYDNDLCGFSNVL